MKKQLGLLFCLTVSDALFGSVILDIGTGILVETAGSVSVKVDNLIETGSGFFIGEITSGPQTGMAEFAGMSLGSSLTGSITRITGDAAGSSAAKATKSARCYTINNTSGCDLSTNMHINRTFSENSKQNSMKGSITGFESVSSNSKTHGSVASLNTIIGVVIPAGCSEWRLAEEIPKPVRQLTIDANAVCDGVALTWVTESNMDSEGFLILRSEFGDGEFEQITACMIPVQENNSSGAEYTYMDKTVASETTYFYKIQEKSLEGNLSEYGPVEATSCFVPLEYALFQNYPNPFNPWTTIQFHVSEPCFVSLKIYNLLGKEVTTLVHEKRNTGVYELTWNAGDLSSGMYIYRLTAGDFTKTRKLILKK